MGGFAAGGDPCGSSAGSGVGVSAGFAAAALGSETDGSIICPSNRAALYGIKMSVGLSSRSGVVPISSTQVGDGFAFLPARHSPSSRRPRTRPVPCAVAPTTLL